MKKPKRGTQELLYGPAMAYERYGLALKEVDS